MELLLLAIVLAAGPWALRFLPNARVMLLAAVVLCIGVVAGPLFYSFKLVMQMSIDRVLLLLAMCIFAVRFIRSEISTPTPIKADWLVAALVLWLLIRAIPAEAPPGIEGPLERWRTFIAIPAMMYFLGRYAPVSRTEVRWIMLLLVVLGVYLGFTGFCEVTRLYGFVFPKYVVDQSNWEFLGRARGPLLNPTGNGTVLTIAFAAALSRWIVASGREKAFCLAAMGVIGVGILATLTRSVWIGAFLLVGCAFVIYLKRYLVAVAMFAIGAFVFASMVVSPSDLMEMKRDQHLSAADAAKSVQLRPVLAQVARDMILDHPLVGHGYGGYFTSAAPYIASRNQKAAYESVRPYMQHNIILSLAVDSGLIAVGLFLTWLIVISKTAWRLAATETAPSEMRNVGLVMLGCVCGYMFNGMFHDVSVIPMASNFLFFLSGLTVQVGYQGLPYQGLPQPGPDKHAEVEPNKPPALNNA